MARKKKKTNTPAKSDFVALEATVKKLTSMLSHPDYMTWAYSGAARGVRKKLLSIDFSVLRNVVKKVPLINAIINTRVDQMMPFCKPAKEKGEKGFEIVAAHNEKADDEEVVELEHFFEQTGFLYNDEREDDLMDYIQMLTRETLEIDQVATEMQHNRRGESIAFWALDGATITRADPNHGDFSRNVAFLQVIEDKIYNEYTHETMIFDYKNKRADIRFRGFGYSAVEQAIDIITTLLFGYNHMRELFLKDKVPKGFIAIMGDADQEQMDSVRRYWYHAMSGAGGRWNIPILPSGKEGVGLEFKSLGQNNKDMEYHRLMMFLTSIIGAVFSMDMAELGIKVDNSQALIGNDTMPRIQTSKDKGLGSLLAFIQQHLNKILRKVTTKYVFRFTGFEAEDEDRRAGIDKKQLETTKTINELRAEKGDDPLKFEYADHVLNPQSVQMIQAEKQAEQQQEQMGEEEDGQMSDEEEGYADEGEDVDFGEEEDLAELFKSQTDKKVLRFRVK